MERKLLESAICDKSALDALKIYLRLQHKHEDALLLTFVQAAMQQVERRTGQSLLTKTWKITHNNHHVYLDCGPVKEIVEVSLRSKKLKEGEYTVISRHERCCVEVPFAWNVRGLSVTYKAGYGDTFNTLPAALQTPIISMAGALYENRDIDSASSLMESLTSWLQPYTAYRLA